MYSTKLINKCKVDNNAYITIGDPFTDPKPNPFRQGKKGEKLTPFQTKVGCIVGYLFHALWRNWLLTSVTGCLQTVLYRPFR
jgi:hypothetical protein